MINLDQELEQVLNEYSAEVRTVLEESVDEQTNETVRELKQTSPKRKGKYARGWKKQENRTVSGKSVTVYNGKHYRLTHLLEFGHAKRGGTGRTTAHPHIGPAEENAKTGFERKVRDKLEGG